MTHPQRNKPCPCGSGKKFKKCCLHKPPKVVEPKRRRVRIGGVSLTTTRALKVLADSINEQPPPLSAAENNQRDEQVASLPYVA